MPPAPTPKASGALRTIGEVSADTGVAHHVLRYWETRFPALRPLTRAGNRRYYREADIVLVRRIDGLLNREGYTIRGVQQLLTAEAKRGSVVPEPADDLPATLAAIRALLAEALAAD